MSKVVTGGDDRLWIIHHQDPKFWFLYPNFHKIDPKCEFNQEICFPMSLQGRKYSSVILQQNKKGESQGGECHARTMMHSEADFLIKFSWDQGHTHSVMMDRLDAEYRRVRHRQCRDSSSDSCVRGIPLTVLGSRFSCCFWFFECSNPVHLSFVY